MAAFAGLAFSQGGSRPNIFAPPATAPVSDVDNSNVTVFSKGDTALFQRMIARDSVDTKIGANQVSRD
jgi:hypothetical protein